MRLLLEGFPLLKRAVDKLERDQRRIMWIIVVLSFNGSLKTLDAFHLCKAYQLKRNCLKFAASIDFETISGSTYNVNRILWF